MTIGLRTAVITGLVVLAILGGVFFMRWFRDENVQVNPDQSKAISASDEEGIRAALAKKQNVLPGQITYLNINKMQGQYVSGQTQIDSGPGSGAVFFAVKQDNHWIIAAVGNGIPDCSEVDPYNIPSEMLSGCSTPTGLKNR